MDILANSFLGILTGGAWGTKSGYGWGATVFAWFVMLAVGAITVWLAYVLTVKNALDDKRETVIKESEERELRETVTDKQGNEVPSPEALGVIEETTYHPHHH